MLLRYHKQHDPISSGELAHLFQRNRCVRFSAAGACQQPSAVGLRLSEYPASESIAKFSAGEQELQPLLDRSKRDSAAVEASDPFIGRR